MFSSKYFKAVCNTDQVTKVLNAMGYLNPIRVVQPKVFMSPQNQTPNRRASKHLHPLEFDLIVACQRNHAIVRRQKVSRSVNALRLRFHLSLLRRIS